MAIYQRGKLFVGGLSRETTKESLSRYFCRYGDIIDCFVVRNNETDESLGFGFVTFDSSKSVIDVLQSGPHTLDDRTITTGTTPIKKPETQHDQLFLGGLPSNATETDLRTFFGRYGKVTKAVIIYDKATNKSKGFGFLSFEKETSVKCVIAERYVNINGKQVVIERATPKYNRGLPGGLLVEDMLQAFEEGQKQGAAMREEAFEAARLLTTTSASVSIASKSASDDVLTDLLKLDDDMDKKKQVSHLK